MPRIIRDEVDIPTEKLVLFTGRGGELRTLRQMSHCSIQIDDQTIINVGGQPVYKAFLEGTADQVMSARMAIENTLYTDVSAELDRRENLDQTMSSRAQSPSVDAEAQAIQASLETYRAEYGTSPARQPSFPVQALPSRPLAAPGPSLSAAAPSLAVDRSPFAPGCRTYAGPVSVARGPSLATGGLSSSTHGPSLPAAAPSPAARAPLSDHNTWFTGNSSLYDGHPLSVPDTSPFTGRPPTVAGSFPSAASSSAAAPSLAATPSAAATPSSAAGPSTPRANSQADSPGSAPEQDGPGQAKKAQNLSRRTVIDNLKYALAMAEESERAAAAFAQGKGKKKGPIYLVDEMEMAYMQGYLRELLEAEAEANSEGQE